MQNQETKLQGTLKKTLVFLINIRDTQNRIDSIENCKIESNQTKIVKLYLIQMFFSHILTKSCGSVQFVVYILQTETNQTKTYYVTKIY